MARRSSAETIAVIVRAFFEASTWTQAELARRARVTVETVRKTLLSLQADGWPFQREEDVPHVFWSLPKGWFPDGVLLTGADVPELLRLLARAPKSRARDKLLATVLRAAPRSLALERPEVAWITPSTSSAEQTYLPIAEDALAQRIALHLRYFSASRGVCEHRHASVQRVVSGPPARLCVVCHRSNGLKWFRVDNIVDARLDSAEPYRAADSSSIDAYVQESVEGFHGGGEAAEHAFFVREPEARWVQSNLLPPMRFEPLSGGIRVAVRTAAPLRVARYVVGLGSAARPETPALVALVDELARGALSSCAHGATSDRNTLNGHSVTTIDRR